jgi:hydrogenase maturation protease
MDDTASLENGPEGAVCRALVIGYGSPIRGDDAVGPLVAERLAEMEQAPGVTVVSRHILTADLLPELCAADLIVFIDATHDGEPGSVTCQPLAPSAAAPAMMAHFLDPRELLAWAAALYGHRPRAYLVSTPAQNLDYAHCELSAVVAGAVPSLIECVQELLVANG